MSSARRIKGNHRASAYESRRAIQIGGIGALVEQRRRARSPYPNRLSAEASQSALSLVQRFQSSPTPPLSRLRLTHRAPAFPCDARQPNTRSTPGQPIGKGSQSTAP